MTHAPRGDGPAAASGSGAQITPLDIQQKEFRVSRFGGYRMRDVDEFLDQLTEVVSGMVEENARLRRQAGSAPVVGSPDLDDVARQADEIIQRARDEAARIDAEARAHSAAAGTPSAGSDDDRAAVKAFLSQEREFLQSLAGLVQGHAEVVKGMVKGARRPEAAEVADTEVAETPAPPEVSTMPEPERSSPEPEEPTESEATDAADEPDRVIEVRDTDATQSMPVAEEPGELAQARPAPTGGSDRGNDSDASLRDLFWGEED